MQNRNDRITLVLGGTRSGKSSYAESLLSREEDSSVLYVATAERREGDVAMCERIQRHQSRRPLHWLTLECPLKLGKNLREYLAKSPCDVVMIDCVTMLASNVLFSLADEENLEELENALRRELNDLISVMKESSCKWVLVSSEIGCGVVPASRLSRNYADALGMCNQLLSAVADRAVLVVAGRPLELPPYPDF